MSRWEGCPDANNCGATCPGRGLVRIWAGCTVLAEEPYCSQTRSTPSSRDQLLAAIARRGVCAEIAVDAGRRDLGGVVLAAQTPGAAQQEMLFVPAIEPAPAATMPIPKAA